MVHRIGQQPGNYHLLHLLGQGGFADAYLGSTPGKCIKKFASQDISALSSYWLTHQCQQCTIAFYYYFCIRML